MKTNYSFLIRYSYSYLFNEKHLCSENHIINFVLSLLIIIPIIIFENYKLKVVWLFRFEITRLPLSLKRLCFNSLNKSSTFFVNTSKVI